MSLWSSTSVEPGWSLIARLIATLALLTACCGRPGEAPTSRSDTRRLADAPRSDAPPAVTDGGPATGGTDRQPDLVLEAELDTPGPQAPAPGHAYVIAISRYRVIRSIHGNYPHPIVLVGHDGADMSSAAFHRGVRHRLELTRQFPAGASLLQPFASEAVGYGAYFCTAYRVIPAGGP